MHSGVCDYAIEDNLYSLYKYYLPSYYFSAKPFAILLDETFVIMRFNLCLSFLDLLDAQSLLSMDDAMHYLSLEDDHLAFWKLSFTHHKLLYDTVPRIVYARLTSFPLDIFLKLWLSYFPV